MKEASEDEVGYIWFCCCIPLGKAGIAVKFDKNAYQPGETIKAAVEVDTSDAYIGASGISLKVYIWRS